MALTKEEKERRREQRRIEKWNKTHKIINEIDHKKCSICEEWLPSTTEYFYNHKSNSIDGLHPCCKSCASKRSSDWQKENRDKLLIYLQRYNKSKKGLEKFREYTANNKDKRKAWRQNNKDKLNEYRLYREASKTHEISEKEWKACKQYFSNKCAYCGLPESEHKLIHNQQLHREHVDHNGSNRLDNCVPSCKNCNSSKNTKLFEEWYTEEYNENYTKERYEKIIKWLNEDYEIYIDD